jgi:hypothetical protein
MYVIRHSITGNAISSHLFEMTAKDLREAQASDTYDIEANTGDGVFHEHVTAERAHRHVKQGRIHSTPLYIDDRGRIRYARDGY